MDIISTNPNRPGFFAFGQVAVGVIAFGQAALGVIAVGQIARGVFCVGQGAIGVVCVGQGSVGLWYATGMVGLAGQRGMGLVLHLLPRFFREEEPKLPESTPIQTLLRGESQQGWISARLVNRGGEPEVSLEGGVRVDTTAIRATLLEGLARRADRVHLFVRTEVVVDDARYRSAHKHMDLFAESAIAYPSNPPRRLGYGSIGKGKVTKPATGLAIALRTTLWLAVVALVSLVAFWPLADALFD